MPTANPRINVTLSPSLDALVTRLAGLERVSKSMVLRELLETAEPALTHAVALMEAAQGASVKARQTLARDLQGALSAVEGTTALAIQNMATHTRDLVAEAESVTGRRPARVGAASAARTRRVSSRRPKGAAAGGGRRPPSSNRGVK